MKGFEGSRADLVRRLAEPDLIAAYNNRRTRDLKRTYPEGTLGACVQWFETECPTYTKLADATKKDYTAAFQYLRPEFDVPLHSITQPELYEVRDRCAVQKWPRFADKMMSALSSMFSQAVKRGKMPTNPAKGIDKAHRADPNANREWSPEEWPAATANAPTEIMIPLMLARYVGFRGQTIASVQWKNYQPDARFGKCFRHVAKKNAEQSWVLVAPELQAYLDSLDRTSLNIATRTDGRPWASEKEMQTAVSHYLRRLEKDGLIGAGTTLHGLRVSYAAELGRGGASNGDVAAALGDRSERMGKHYTRHVENETRVIRAFEGKKKP
ncbi:MAG: tyrosine-type recombinase/integrase [Bradyrhizobium sp.]|uniref:tyrosine-type recombinase/integrase n=1 Tax=Bradyrhizobium sp. TaxID=376 RepID=UPI002724F549|nr:tyrosine-type recombinase/integrase [Bradyrhizobium sp.]MDO8398999.1 tyrosine-type recombinase/integrase [Bradyrhizobium sp.]